MVRFLCRFLDVRSYVISTHHQCAFTTVFLHFYIIIVWRIRKERTCQDIRMSQLSVIKNHINDGFGAQNVGVIMSMSGVQYSGSYGVNVSLQAVHMLRRLIKTRILHCQFYILLWIIHQKTIMIGWTMGSHVIKVWLCIACLNVFLESIFFH